MVWSLASMASAKGLNGAHVERSQVFEMPFLVFPSAQMHAIRAINDVDGGQNQDRHLPAGHAVDELS